MSEPPIPHQPATEELVEELAEGDLDRILTVPNVITAVRLLSLPVFVYLLFGADDRHAAGWVLLAIGSTDWVDGFLARRWNQITTIGKVIDPVADRLLFFVGIGAILIDGSVPWVVAGLVLFREIAIAIGTLVLAGMGARRIDVTWAGKAATFLLMGVFPAFLLSNSDAALADVYEVIAWACAVPGLALSYWSGVLYIPKGRRALAEGRADLAARETDPSRGDAGPSPAP